jgi:putative protease
MENCIGHVTHYYDKIGVAVLSLTAELKIHDAIQILGHSSDVVQKVNSLEIEHQKIQSAGPMAEVALKVDEPVHKGDKVFLITEETYLEEAMKRFR